MSPWRSTRSRSRHPGREQFRNWNDLNVEPYDKYKVDPYTRTRVILMNGIEVESIIFSHQFARHTDNLEISTRSRCRAGSSSSSRRPSTG